MQTVVGYRGIEVRSVFSYKRSSITEARGRRKAQTQRTKARNPRSMANISGFKAANNRPNFIGLKLKVYGQNPEANGSGLEVRGPKMTNSREWTSGH